MSVVPAVVKRAELGQLGNPVAGQSGESVGIWRTGNGLLFKEFKETAVLNGRPEALAHLVAVGRGEAPVYRADREALLAATSSPAARVIDAQGNLVGCLIPEAGKKFRSDTGKLREIDTLAQTDARLAAQGLPISRDQRISVCRGIAAVAAALERYGLVYSDWNYANALWCPDDGSAFIIDVDGCRAEKMPNICQSGWEDPLTSTGTPADMYTDRFRVALLVARCLTGERHLIGVLHALSNGDTELTPGGRTCLTCCGRRSRSPGRASPSCGRRSAAGRRPVPGHAPAAARAAGPRRGHRPRVEDQAEQARHARPRAPADQKQAGPVPRAPQRTSAVLFTVLLSFAVLIAVAVGIIVGLHH